MHELLAFLTPPSQEGSRILFARLALNLLVGAALATALKFHYVRFSRSLANRSDFAHNFLTITLSTILIISVVKSSIPISLGLVGALSIVRFRTPIRDPEELSYLFLAIGIGVGLGAGYVAVISGALAVILACMSLRRRPGSRPPGPLYLEVNLPDAPEPGAALDKLNEVLARTAGRAQMQRLEAQSGALQAAFALRCTAREQLSRVTGELTRQWPGATVTILDQEQFPGA